MVQDMKLRETLARVDDEARRRKVEIAREIIYEKNYVVNSKAVDALLKDQSLVPTDVSCQLISLQISDDLEQNAFSKRLNHLGFNLFVMLIVDLLHEFELGVWKALLIHLLRMLEAMDKNLLHELDRRYGSVVM